MRVSNAMNQDIYGWLDDLSIEGTPLIGNRSCVRSLSWSHIKPFLDNATWHGILRSKGGRGMKFPLGWIRDSICRRSRLWRGSFVCKVERYGLVSPSNPSREKKFTYQNYLAWALLCSADRFRTLNVSVVWTSTLQGSLGMTMKPTRAKGEEGSCAAAIIVI